MAPRVKSTRAQRYDEEEQIVRYKFAFDNECFLIKWQ